MTLEQLSNVMRRDTIVYVTDNPTSPDCLYCGRAEDMPHSLGQKREVLEISARYFHSQEAFGITVIVKPTE